MVASTRFYLAQAKIPTDLELNGKKPHEPYTRKFPLLATMIRSSSSETDPVTNGIIAGFVAATATPNPIDDFNALGDQNTWVETLTAADMLRDSQPDLFLDAAKKLNAGFAGIDPQDFQAGVAVAWLTVFEMLRKSSRLGINQEPVNNTDPDLAEDRLFDDDEPAPVEKTATNAEATIKDRTPISIDDLKQMILSQQIPAVTIGRVGETTVVASTVISGTPVENVLSIAHAMEAAFGGPAEFVSIDENPALCVVL
jgi:hypothetical protein